MARLRGPVGPAGAGASRTQVDPAAAADLVESNRSWLNPSDAATMVGRTVGLNEHTTLAQFLQEVLGLDLDGPATQLVTFTDAQLSSQSAVDKMANIAEGRNLRPGAGARAQAQVARAEEAMAAARGGAPGGAGALDRGVVGGGGAGGIDFLMGKR